MNFALDFLPLLAAGGEANSALDLLRLLVVPFFAWAAYTDVQTRRIPNKVWPPLFVAGVCLLSVTVWQSLPTGAPYAFEVLPAAVISLGVVAPVAYLFWLFGGFGGADAKALLVLSLLFPVFPAYEFLGLEFPVFRGALGSFAFTILTNTVLAGILYPTALFAKNARNGEFSLPMFLGERVPAEDVTETYGTLMGTNDGMTAGSLDLDAVRMYLTWRDTTLSAVRSRPADLRDPASLPADRNHPGGGEIRESADESGETGAATAPGPTDGPTGDLDADDDAPMDETGGDTGAASDTEAAGDAGTEGDSEPAASDEWGAEAFLNEIEGDAYGTSPESLREGLDVLADADAVWVSPGIPFIVPMFVGLVLAVTVGDLIAAAMSFI